MRRTKKEKMSHGKDTLLQRRKVSSGRGERGRVFRIQTRYNILRIIQDVFCNNRRTNNRTKMDTKESGVEKLESKEMVHKSLERGENRGRKKRDENGSKEIDELCNDIHVGIDWYWL